MGAKTARFEEEKFSAKSKFTTHGRLTQTSYNKVVGKDKKIVAKEDSKLKRVQKDAKMSQIKLAKLQSGNFVRKAEEREQHAVAQLAKADTMARMSSRAASASKEQAHKATALLDAKNSSKQAGLAVAAK